MKNDMVVNDMTMYQDTKFSHGMWYIKDDVTISWAKESVKTVVKDDSVYTLATTKPVQHRGDTIHIPALSFNFTSPGEGVIGVETYHHIGGIEDEARFELNKTADSPSIAVNSKSNITSLTAGDITAEVNTAPASFAISFKDKNGELLTQLGAESIGYVRDRREHKLEHRPFMTAQLDLQVQEKVYGLGERFGPLIKNGQRVELWNENSGTSTEYAYKNIPFYLTNKGYGVFVDSTTNVTYEVQSERTTRVNIVVPGETIRFYIIYGPSPKEIIQRYCRLTGVPALPAPWTFGLWLSTSFTTNYDINTVSQFLDGMKEREIPVSIFHFDCFWMKAFQWCDFDFDTENFPDPKAILKELKDKYGLRICLWLNSYIAQESRLFTEGSAKGYLLKKTNGRPYQTDLWQAGMGYVDFTNPDAVKWYQAELSRLIDLGVDAFKTDFGERIPVFDIEYFNGKDPVFMHNYYTHLYNKTVFEVLEKKRGKNEACLFARSATAGGQQYPVHWGGDCVSTLEAMAETLRGGLSLAASGFGFWSHDIGGFEGRPDPSVYKRWVAFGLLSSHSRLHGSGSVRVPWAFDDEATDVLKKFTNLKLSLMPYLFAAAIEAHTLSTPVIRPTYFEFPDEPTAWDADTQYLLGPSLLVAPVFTAESGKVTYYVPEGKWYGILDGKIRSSGWSTENHGYLSLPLLQRPNSIVIIGADNTKPEYDWNKGFTANIFDITSKVSVQIPDPKKIGEYGATVTAQPGAKQGVIEVTADGNAANWNVKVNGTEIASVEGGSISGKDEFGTSIIKVSGKSATITLA